MKPTAAGKRSTADPETRLKGFIAKFEPGHQKLIRAMRKALRKRLPTAHELVYDNYNFFVIGYGPTERPSDAILSLTGSANGVGLCFIHGASLPDPQKILLGSGNQTRFIHVDSVEVLARPAVSSLISAATAKARTPLQPKGRGSLIIRSVSSKQRPRRKRAKD
ncbi:MAG TPA: hypothetical protein VLK88_14100 [Gemmatimonadales bacterium]|nr:hypothetical protein [Gemmatimonadales bacterium]